MSFDERAEPTQPTKPEDYSSAPAAPPAKDPFTDLEYLKNHVEELDPEWCCFGNRSGWCSGE